MKGFMACLMGSVLSLLSCSRATMPESELESVEFTRSGTMAGFEYEGRVKKDSSGVFVLRAMKETYGPLFEKQLTAEQMTRFREIIVEEKMYKYKERYTPMMEVLDGWSWEFHAKFADGSCIYSHGSNASPRGEGLHKIRQYMVELIQDSEVAVDPDAGSEEDDE